MATTPMDDLITQRVERQGEFGEKLTTTFMVRIWAESSGRFTERDKIKYKKILMLDVKDVILQEYKELVDK